MGADEQPIAEPEVLRHLATPSAHAGWVGAVTRVETVETHMSWLFFVDGHVLKRKKAVRYPFLDFSTPAARERCCREELRLNARLAPGVYRGLMVLQHDAGGLHLRPEAAADPAAATLDWLVWMRRLPAACMLDRRIAAGMVDAAEVDALAGVLARFYRAAPAVALAPATYVARLAREAAVNRALLLHPGLLPDGVADALDRFDAALARQADALGARAAQGRIVDGHGDLRPEHVCLLRPPVVFDCLEFNAALRQVDPLDELAFLALECELAGAGWIGARLVPAVAAALGDRADGPLGALYTAYRALLRARLSLAHLLEPRPRSPQRWQPQAGRYVRRARAALAALEQGLTATADRGRP